MSLTKVSQLDSFFHMLMDLIEKLLKKNSDYFEILIESGTNLRITYKDKDQFNDLLK